MTGYSKNNVIEEIKSRCNIVDVIGQVVTLKNAGTNFKGLCPFHGEKTPSFVVSEGKQIFTCFGCGASGDVLSFVMKYYNLDFIQAVERLAKEYNIDLPTTYENSGKKAELYDINKRVARFFFDAIRDGRNEGYRYLDSRGISREMIKHFGLGYADESWDSLCKKFLPPGGGAAGEELKKKMLKLGLIDDSKGHCYDKFRNRIIFPIINTSGKVIGFGGRTLSKDGIPKYLNSPESLIYSKKNNLYGLNVAKQGISKQDIAVLVEGYIDVISLHQRGIDYAVATLGTALTENQAKLLRRYTRNIVFAYDMDSAGRAATMRGIEILKKQDLNIKIMKLPEGKDPDEYIKKYGRDEFESRIKESLPATEYMLEQAKSGYDLRKNEDKLKYIKEALGILRDISSVEADIYLQKLSKDTGVSPTVLKSELDEKELTNKVAVYDRDNLKEVTQLERYLLKLAILQSRYVPEIAKYNDLFSMRMRDVIGGILSVYEDGVVTDSEKLKSVLGAESWDLYSDVLENVHFSVSEEDVFEDCMKKIAFMQLEKQESILIAKLSMADSELEAKDDELIRDMMRQLVKVQKDKKSMEVGINHVKGN